MGLGPATEAPGGHLDAATTSHVQLLGSPNQHPLPWTHASASRFQTSLTVRSTGSVQHSHFFLKKSGDETR